MDKGEKNIGISTMLVDLIAATPLFPDLVAVGLQVRLATSKCKPPKHIAHKAHKAAPHSASCSLTWLQRGQCCLQAGVAVVACVAAAAAAAAAKALLQEQSNATH